MAPADRRRDEALDWARRLHDPAFADWEAHCAWLEADPRNAAAFDEAEAAITEASEGLAHAGRAPSPPPAINDNDMPGRRTPKWGRRGGIAGLAVAAGIVGVVTLPSLHRPIAQRYEIRTAAGEHRTLALADGTRIALNGDTRIALDRAAPRRAELESGEAFFTVVHDGAHPFEVHAGGELLRDVGTAFDVVQQHGTTDVAVREGAVLFDPGGAAVRLGGGQALHVEGGQASVGAVATASVGEWQTDRLSYRDAPLARVAADISRTIGRPVAVDPELAQRSFSGVVMIDPDRARMFRRMGAVMGVEVEPAGTGWRMVSPTR